MINDEKPARRHG